MKTSDRRLVASGTGRTVPRTPALHPVLALQRSAGNRAATLAVQRWDEPWRRTRLLVTPNKAYYASRCNATFDGGGIRRKWSPSVLMNDHIITFDCGPASFAFRAAFPWVGDRFPWYAKYPGGEAWVDSDVEKALDIIDSNWDDEGGGFWDAYNKIKGILKSDIATACSTK